MESSNSTSGSHEGGNILSGVNPIQFNILDPLPLFIVQTIIILMLCYVMTVLLQRIRQPKVVAEVLTGIILGPSIMGQIPGFNNAIFPPQSIPFLNLVSQLGLVLFLFLVGLELDPGLIIKRAQHAVRIASVGLIVPFAFSAGVIVFLYHRFETISPLPPFSQYVLCCGIAMSLTAFPVLARILAEMQLMSTTVGFITVCAAAAGDIVAWVLLALLVSLINATTPIMPLYVVLMAIGWCLILVFVVRPLLMWLVRVTHSEEEPSQKMIACTLIIVLTSAFVTNTIGIHSIFGGFLVGLLIPHDSGFAEGLTRRIEDLVGVYFLPVFFTLSGLKTQVGLLNNAETWGLVILVTLASFVGKMLGCVGAAKSNGMTWREALSIGFLMNCKGLVEYIVLNIGHDSGVISDRIFVIMIAMCLTLTMITTPFISYLYPVSYQKEMEAKREAERKLRAAGGKGASSGRGGVLSKLKGNLRRRRRGAASVTNKDDQGHPATTNVECFEDLDGACADATDYDSGLEDLEPEADMSWKNKNAIMFCLDKTPNAPGVMTLLQLFSGTSVHRRPRPYVPKEEEVVAMDEKIDQGEQGRHRGILQPSIDISDPSGNRRTTLRQTTVPEYEATYSKIYAIRLLHISERTSAAMLTASRCMDRLYKDTVMMMVMAFAKLNSVPLKPLVALSTDTAQSTVAQDILDRAVDLEVGWIVFPWNSSHLSILPTNPIHPVGSHSLQPGLAPMAVNTTTTVNSAVSVPPSPLGQPLDAHAGFFGAPVDSLVEPTRHFPYNISRYFDHDEAQKIASGGHVDLSQGGERHRTSIASNTKVLSRLIPSSAENNIATAVLVDRGLGLIGGVEHIVVPLLGGEDDYDTLCLASCLARSTKCFVTILQVTSNNPTTAADRQPSQFQSHPSSPPVERSAPFTPEPISGTRTQHSRLPTNDQGKPPLPSTRNSEDRIETVIQMAPPSSRGKVRTGQVVPKDDETLFKKFFPCKPRFNGSQFRQRQLALERKRTHGRSTSNTEPGGGAGDAWVDDDDDDDLNLEGVMVLSFHEFADAVQWARNCLSAQDLMVIGLDSNVTIPLSVSSQAQASNTFLANYSRVPSMEDTRLVAGDRKLASPISTSPSILERRGVNLSPPPRGDAPLIHQPITLTSTTASITAPASARPSLDEERRGRSEGGAGARVSRARSRGRVSIRSLSRGRRVETPGIAGSSSAQAGAGLTTCQVMLGVAADHMMHSGVASSLLVVRSRWFYDRTDLSATHHAAGTGAGMSDYGSPASQLRTNVASTPSSYQSGPTDAIGQRVLRDRALQYHSQQQAHHARQHSQFSQELVNDNPRAGAAAGGVTFTGNGMGSVSTDAFVHQRSASDMHTPRASTESY